jgi:RHH-type transcriptional regulator, proline utilization regulon repressor / proline dehydrogenase / delta 1-pyrroline-5-carboxylate dehydrogenase
VPAATPLLDGERREERILQLGQEIFARAYAASPSPVRADWWIERLLDWSTADPGRKLQLFRFIDVLPTLRTDDEIVRHLAEYLLGCEKGFSHQHGVAPASRRCGEHGDGARSPSDAPHQRVALPAPFARLLRSAARGAWYTPQLAAAARSGALRMARRFIAGQNAEEAVDTALHLRSQQMAFTLDLLGEATTSNAQADAYAAHCIELLEHLSAAAAAWPGVERIDTTADGLNPRVNLSIKLTSMEPHFDPLDAEGSIARVLERLRPVLRTAQRLGAFVNVDMEQYRYKDLTLATFRRVLDEPEFTGLANVGIVLQAYLRDAARDLDDLLAWVRRRGTPIAVRLVKGAYWDYETMFAIQEGWPIPVWTQKWESDAAYEQLTRRLLDERRLIRLALGSHNVRSLAAAMAYAEWIGVSPREYEIQMLLGMGDPLKRAVADMGYTLRVYTPFGELIPGMAYLIRRLLENTSNESFLKNGFTRQEPVQALLADPAEVRPPSSPLPAPVSIDPEEGPMPALFHSEPPTDFAQPAARASMQQALPRVRERFGREYPLVIAGESVATGEWIDSVNPSQFTQVVGRFAAARAEDVDHAVEAAQSAFARWSRLGARERGEYLLRAAAILRRRRFELAAWIIYEVGKPWREADADVAEAVDFLEFYPHEMQRLEDRPRRRDYPGEENAYVYQPRGVAAVIAPWNFPLAILTGMTSAALAAGNTVVMKPAEQSSVIAAKLMEVFQEAGLPPAVVNYLPGRGEVVGARLVSHPGVSLIAFTGSREVGVAIYEEASRWRPGQAGLKRVIAEMGGKNAIIVDSDADLDEAITGVINSVFSYAGQKCSACSRAIVLQEVYDAFVGRLVEATRSLPIGPAEAPATVVGPVIDAASCDRILSYIEGGRRDARLLHSADLGALPDRGYFVPPTIFEGVPPEAPLAREEIFGPVLAIMAARDFEHALEIANGTDYALTGGLFSRDPTHIELARREFKVGNLYINRGITGARVDRQPFGGLKMSGVGSKAGGPDYLLQFLEPKAITENTQRHGFAPEPLMAGRARG